MPPEYDSYDSRDDSRYDSYDSRYDSRDRPPPRKAGYGIAGLIVASVAVGAEILGVVLVAAFNDTVSQPGYGGGTGAGCMCFVALLASLIGLSVCALVTSLTAGGLGVGGIVAGRGIGRRLGIYAVVLAILSLIPPVALGFWILAQGR